MKFLIFFNQFFKINKNCLHYNFLLKKENEEKERRNIILRVQIMLK